MISIIKELASFMEEEWKDIVEYETLYQISNLGRVRSLDRTIIYKNGHRVCYKGRLKMIQKMKDGYYAVTLSKDGKKKNLKIARLVAIAFIPNPSNLPEVNHIDEDKSNNTVQNLEWCTKSYNINYGTRNERVGSLYMKRVYQYSFRGELIRIYNSLSEAAAENNCSIGNLSFACKNTTEGATCKGCFFSYEQLSEEQLHKAIQINDFWIKHRNRHHNYGNIKAL